MNPLRVKSLKCPRCGIQCGNNRETIDMVIMTCKESGICGIQTRDKQMNEFVKRMEEKSKGIPKQFPVLLMPQPRTEAELEAEQRKACPELYCGSSFQEIKGDKLEFDVPDVLVISINKKGHVSHHEHSE